LASIYIYHLYSAPFGAQSPSGTSDPEPPDHRFPPERNSYQCRHWNGKPIKHQTAFHHCQQQQLLPEYGYIFGDRDNDDPEIAGKMGERR